jgi:hypothetical protein
MRASILYPVSLVSLFQAKVSPVGTEIAWSAAKIAVMFASVTGTSRPVPSL